MVGTTGFILNLQPNQLEGFFLANDDVSSRNRFLYSSPVTIVVSRISCLVRRRLLAPAVKINDDGTLYVELPAILVKLRKFVKKC